jgi:hypothetical protein
MQITASAAIATISARMSCVMRSGIGCREFPHRGCSRFSLKNPPTDDRAFHLPIVVSVDVEDNRMGKIMDGLVETKKPVTTMVTT